MVLDAWKRWSVNVSREIKNPYYLSHWSIWDILFSTIAMSRASLLGMCLPLVLLLLFSNGNAQALGGSSMTENEIDSTTFVATDGAPNVTGLIYYTQFAPLYHILHISRGTMLTLAYNVSGVTNATTLTVALMIRDLAIMPATDINAIATSVAGAIVKLTTNITTTNYYGSASTYVDGAVIYTPGASDSYGNAFAPGDMYGFDYAIFFTSPVANQNASVSFSSTVLNLVSW
jgi:hypothetical protein